MARGTCRMVNGSHLAVIHFSVEIILKYFVSSECVCLSHFSSNTFLQEAIRYSSFYSPCIIAEKTAFHKPNADKHQIIILKSLLVCQKSFFFFFTECFLVFYYPFFFFLNRDFPNVSLVLN